MQYPKPLSEKTINKKYEELGLSEEQVEYVHDFTLACVNLYGVAYAADIWDIYRELSGRITTPVLHRKDMYGAFDIMRREEVPYLVLENSEVFEGAEDTEGDRLIVARELAGTGRNKYDRVLDLLMSLHDVDYFVPDDLVSYSNMPACKEERMLVNTLSSLKVNVKNEIDTDGNTLARKHYGEKLGDFVLTDETKVAASEIYDLFKLDIQIGKVSIDEAAQRVFNTLALIGVMLTQSQADHIAARISNMINNIHTWNLCGWTINELHSLNS
jgi:hypothetical protein